MTDMRSKFAQATARMKAPRSRKPQAAARAVSCTHSLATFLPQGDPRKLALIRKKRKQVAGELTRLGQDDDAPPAKIARRLAAQTRYVRGSITQLFYPKAKTTNLATLSYPHRGIFTVDGVKWKGKLLSFDDRLFVHEIHGHLDDSDSRFSDTYVADKIETQAVPISSFNKVRVTPRGSHLV